MFVLELGAGSTNVTEVKAVVTYYNTSDIATM